MAPARAATPTDPNLTDAEPDPDVAEDADAADATDAAEESDDPRLHGDFRRECDGVTLVGVVHDHPASVHRARAAIDEYEPAVVALEAPPLAVPLVRAAAESTDEDHSESTVPPSLGGELRAAATAASACDADVVGVDGPTPGFLARLARLCWRERVPLGTLRQLSTAIGRVTRQALRFRVAALTASSSLPLSIDAAAHADADAVREYDCTAADPPAVQATDERERARRSQALVGALDSPAHVALRDRTREAHMATELRSLRSRGHVVAVVGLDHLDSVASALERE